MPVENNLEAVAFSTALEGFGRAFRSRLSPPAHAALRELKVDFDHLQPAYPLAIWERTVMVVAADLFSGQKPEEGWRRLGREFVGGYSETLLGKAIMGMARVVGPRRFMERIGRNLRSGGNFAVVVSKVVSSNEVHLESRLETAFIPDWAERPMVMHHYRHGIFEGALHELGVSGTVQLEAIDISRQSARYRVCWP